MYNNKQVIDDAALLLGSYHLDNQLAIQVIDEMISYLEKHESDTVNMKLLVWKAQRNYLKSWHAKNSKRIKRVVKAANSL